MKGQFLMYEGVKIYVLYTEIPEEPAELDLGFLGKDAYKSVESVLVNGIDITALLEQHLETIEEKLN